VSWSPKVKAPSGKSYTINGYVDDANIVERVETWLGENIMGDMSIVANYADWRDFGGFKFPAEIKESRRGWPFFQGDVASGAGHPAPPSARLPRAAGSARAPGGAGRRPRRAAVNRRRSTSRPRSSATACTGSRPAPAATTPCWSSSRPT